MTFVQWLNSLEGYVAKSYLDENQRTEMVSINGSDYIPMNKINQSPYADLHRQYIFRANKN